MIRTQELNDVLKEGSESHEKLFKLLISGFTQLESQLITLSSDVKTSIRSGEQSEFSATALTTLIKNSEKALLTKLNVQTTKLNTKIENLEDELKLTKQENTKDSESIKKKLIALNLDKRLENLEIDILAKVKNQMIDPLEFEIKENFKTVLVVEQMMKLQTWNIESAQKEFNSRFENHKEKIACVETTVSDFIKNADDMILKIISPIKKSVELCEITIKNLYSQFEKDMKEVLDDLNGKDDEREKRFVDVLENLKEFKEKIDNSERNIKGGFFNHVQLVEGLASQITNQNESFKQEMRGSFIKSFLNTKNELMVDYQSEIIAIEEKLKWLPIDIKDISEMTPVEARLYTIETRIRAEEVNRINQVNQMVEGKT
jgi:hypothetical protein